MLNKLMKQYDFLYNTIHPFTIDYTVYFAHSRFSFS